MLASISAEYYLRLEQGRDRNPSAQVLRSLARVLQLKDERYLLSLAADHPPAGRRRARRETAPPSTVRFIHTLPVPAFIEDATWTCSPRTRSPVRSHRASRPGATGCVTCSPIIYHPRPDTDCAEKLAFLASFSTTARPRQAAPPTP